MLNMDERYRGSVSERFSESASSDTGSPQRQVCLFHNPSVANFMVPPILFGLLLESCHIGAVGWPLFVAFVALRTEPNSISYCAAQTRRATMGAEFAKAIFDFCRSSF